MTATPQASAPGTKPMSVLALADTPSETHSSINDSEVLQPQSLGTNSAERFLTVAVMSR
jgi:hypothetical protein